jgi:hypothetical protein
MQQFIAAAAIAGWNEKVLVVGIQAYLRDKAFEWFIELPAETKASFNAIKEEFKNKFEKVDDLEKATRDFINCRQKPNQSIEEFVDEFKFAARQAGKNMNELVNEFTCRLQPALSLKVSEKEPASITRRYDMRKNVKISCSRIPHLLRYPIMIWGKN